MIDAVDPGGTLCFAAGEIAFDGRRFTDALAVAWVHAKRPVELRRPRTI